MRAEIYWIVDVPEGRLAVLPRPRGGDWLHDEIKSLRRAGVDVLACLLTPEEMAELELGEEAACCAANAVRFVPFPIDDRGVPASGQEALAVVRELASVLAEGKSVAVHCRQGVGRSALVAACVLGSLGVRPDQAFERIARARGCPVPDTGEQRAWVKAFVDRHFPGTGARRPVS
jgi:protein-tyrosine phosphatase